MGMAKSLICAVALMIIFCGCVAETPAEADDSELGQGNAVIDPALITDENTVAGWVYFLYPNREYPDSGCELWRRREDQSDLQRVSSMRCDSYDIVGDSIYFAEYSLPGEIHGVLYVIRPQQEPKALAEELCFYQIYEGYIYYAHSFDTTGVGIEGHALHRMDLDGENHIVAAYEANGPGIGGGHIGEIKDGYVCYDGYRQQLGQPADGTEALELTTPTDTADGWIYYSTNRLFKARPDGSECSILEGDADSWIFINRITDGWIYYLDRNKPGIWHKIKTDGTGKTEISEGEYGG